MSRIVTVKFQDSKGINQYNSNMDKHDIPNKGDLILWSNNSIRISGNVIKVARIYLQSEMFEVVIQLDDNAEYVEKPI